MANAGWSGSHWKVFVALACALIVAACASGIRPSTQPRMNVVGYVSDRDPLPAISAGKLDALNFAFARVNPAHEVYLPRAETGARLERIVALRKANPRLKVLLSIGGWGAGHFSEAAATEQARHRFADTAVALLRRYDLDGLDVDWEYPAHPGPGISYRPEDRETFPLLLQALRSALDNAAGDSGRRYLLTIAAADGKAARGLDFDRIVPLLDWINLMTYDFYGEGSPHTGHHAGLHASASVPARERDTEQAVDAFLRAGVPPAKLHVGMAFYGKLFSAVGPGNHGLGQPHDGQVKFVSYVQIRREFMASGAFERHWDARARAAWLWDAKGRRMISYEDPRALREKVRYAKAKGLGGVMYWEHDQDEGEALLDVALEALGREP